MSVFDFSSHFIANGNLKNCGTANQRDNGNYDRLNGAKVVNHWGKRGVMGSNCNWRLRIILISRREFEKKFANKFIINNMIIHKHSTKR